MVPESSELDSVVNRDLHRESIDSFFFGRLNFEKQSPVDYNEQHLRLRPLQELLKRLDDPHKQYAVLHVAGTKGKGSVCTMLHQIMVASGRTCGLYTSPHVFHINERFTINESAVSDSELASVVQALAPVVAEVDRLGKDDPGFGSLTFFDLCTATAFLHFARQRVDVAVIEVGMGGRLDSTNVVEPQLTWITNISLDHTQQLGNTEPAIAREKGGIIKNSIPVISGVQQPEARQVIRDLASQHSAPLLELGERLHWRAEDPMSGALRVVVTDCDGAEQWASPDLQTPLLGRHQRDNIALAVGGVHQLKAMGWAIADAALQQGIGKAAPLGRLQRVGTCPTVIVDVAHNPASFTALVNTLRAISAEDGIPSAEEMPLVSRTLVFAVSRDKDYEQMLQIALGYFDRIILTQFHRNPRATDPTHLEAVARRVTDPLRPVLIEVEPDPKTAFRRAWEGAQRRDEITVAGSLFLLAEIGSWNPSDSGVDC